jgi:hypothetical protein
MCEQKLQRAIAESRGQSANRSLPIALAKSTSVDGSYRSHDSAPENRGKQGEIPAAGATTITRRKYRRHPRVSLVPTVPPPCLGS